MGAKHYTKAVDCWAVGCVLAELASLRPIFKGEEAKLDSKKNVPFQRDQLLKIFEVLGTPDESDWPGVVHMPEYQSMKRLDQCVFVVHNFRMNLMQYYYSFQNQLVGWCNSRIRGPQGYDLMRRLFMYDPDTRLTAKDALQHKWFQDEPKPTWKYVATVPENLTSVLTTYTAPSRQSLSSRSRRTGASLRTRLRR